jgi:hypothetical protein
VNTAINNRYLILGYSVDALGKSHQFTQRLGQPRRYFGAGFSAAALNDQGVLAGSYSGAPAYWDSEQHVKFVPGVALGTLIDISETNWMIGHGNVGGSVRHFIWRPGWAQVRILGSQFPAATTTAVSVNNSGYSAGEAGGRGGVWSPAGAFEPIPLPSDAFGYVQPAEINDAGRVVGRASLITAMGGFLWTKGQPMILVGSDHPANVVYHVSDVDQRGRFFGTIDYDGSWAASAWNGSGQLVGMPSGVGSHIEDVNDCGVAVGWDNGPWWQSPRQPRTPYLWLTEC